jgi:hypothetical protein
MRAKLIDDDGANDARERRDAPAMRAHANATTDGSTRATRIATRRFWRGRICNTWRSRTR